MTAGRSWAVSLSASVALHALVAVALVLLASRTLPVPKPKPSEAPLQLFRVGLMPAPGNRAEASPVSPSEVEGHAAHSPAAPIVMKGHVAQRPVGEASDSETAGSPGGDVGLGTGASTGGGDWAARVVAVSNEALSGDTAAPLEGSAVPAEGDDQVSQETARAKSGGARMFDVPAEGGGGSGQAGSAVTSAGSGSGTAAPGDQRGSAGAAGGPSADVVSLVHARLAAVAAGCYPSAARRFHQQGEVELRFCVDGAGAVASALVDGSSGVASLDRAATDCVAPKAAPFPAPAYGGCFRVPVRFGRAVP